MASSPQAEVALVEATKVNASATLAAAVVARSEQPLTHKRVMQIFQNIHWSLFPANGHGVYEAWKKGLDPDKVL